MNNSMSILKEFYFLGTPVETEIGQVEFIKVKEYPTYIYDLQIFSMSKNEIYYNYNKLNKNGELNDFLKKIKKMSLYDIVLNVNEVKKAYLNVFLRVFSDESILEKINKDNFYNYRKLIMEMNCVKEKYFSSNPVIQRAIERSERLKSQESGKLEFSDIASTIVAFSGKSYEDLIDMTIYQFFLTFYRICQIKDYDTSTLFATVAGDKVQIESFFKHIDMFEEEKHGFTRQEFSKVVGVVKNN